MNRLGLDFHMVACYFHLLYDESYSYYKVKLERQDILRIATVQNRNVLAQAQNLKKDEVSKQ